MAIFLRKTNINSARKDAFVERKRLSSNESVFRQAKAMVKGMALYSETVMDHFRNPRNVGIIENADGVGEVGNAKCGDIMKIYLRIENDVIVDAKFETFGCGSAIASSSMATEMIKGKPVSDALRLTNKAVVEALNGLPAHKIHCSVLAEEAIKKALQNYYEKNHIDYDHSLFPACEGCEHGCGE